MSWMLYFWQAVALLGICSGHNTVYKGYDLSLSSYHLCPVNETVVVSNIVSSISPYKAKRNCGDWLPWKTCEVTLYKQTYQAIYQNVTKEKIRCCKAYEQVGSYCSLPLNRSNEFAAKAGACPNAQVPPFSSKVCEWDPDCPGWQKCCPVHGISYCTEPQPRGNREWCFNVTLTVKTDYNVLVSVSQGMANHTRLLHSVITGSIDSQNISLNYVSSWSVGPFRTTTSFLICSPDTLPLSNTTAKLQLLLINIEEISSVTLEDVDECAYAALSGCSTLANCTNTIGSYQCTCLPGYTDMSLNNTGLYCQASLSEINVTDNHSENIIPTPVQVTKMPHHNDSYQTWLSKQTRPSANPYDSLAKNHTVWDWNITNSTRLPFTAGLENATNQQMSAVPHTSIRPTVAGTTYFHAPLTHLQVFNVTGSSFCVSWTTQSQEMRMFLVVLMQGPMTMTQWETNQTKMETLGASARLTNIHFTNDLRNSTSEDYLKLSLSIQEEIKQSLTPSMLEMVKSGEVRIQITNLAPGSVVVNFTIIFSPSLSRDIVNMSSALMASLQNSSVYTVDSNYTSISDVDECATGVHDCSRWAHCYNTWGSYNCVCVAEYTDTNLDIPGRGCQAPVNVTKNAVSNTTQTTAPTVHLADGNTFTVGTMSNISITRVIASVGMNTSELFRISAPITSSVAVPLPIPTQLPIPVLTTTNTTTTTTPKTRTTSTTTVSLPPPLITSTATVAATVSSITTQPPLRATIVTTPSSPGRASTTPATTQQLTTRPSQCNPPKDSISVECRPNLIAVTVARMLLAACHILDTDLYLGRPDCGINGGNNTHPKLTVAWNECGTELLQNSSHYTAWANLSSSLANDTAMGSATRLHLPIMCSYANSVLISTGYNPLGYDIIKDTITGSGTFRVTVRLLNGTLPIPQNYSMPPEEAVVVEVSLNSTREHTSLVIDKCWATPSSYSLDPINYVFMENSCPIPNNFTTVLENGNSSKSRLSVRIFSFVNHNVIYLHCRIQICIPMTSDTCVPNCIAPTRTLSRSFGSAEASCGPFQRSVKDSVQEGDDSFQLIGFCLLGVGMSLFFIGCFSCLFYYNRNRIGHYNFSFKPKQENFTYHVFNT